MNLDSLREQFEHLTRELDIKLDLVAQTAKQAEQLRQYDLELENKKADLHLREEEVKKDKDNLEEEKSYLSRLGRDLKTKEEEVAKSSAAMEYQRLDLIEKEKVVDEKIKLSKEIDDKLADLFKREAELEKQKGLDRIRKEMLDSEEAKNKATAERLKKFTLQ